MNKTIKYDKKSRPIICPAKVISIVTILLIHAFDLFIEACQFLVTYKLFKSINHMTIK